MTSNETLNTIVNASIRELDKLRGTTGDNRLKIIASALNFEHCRQVVEAYRARGRRADYVHSREDSAANERVMQKLNSHELDVIVQVRKLGEGFDHKFLSVAAVFSVFRNLSPFVQFVGRIMRVSSKTLPGIPSTAVSLYSTLARTSRAAGRTSSNTARRTRLTSTSFCLSRDSTSELATNSRWNCRRLRQARDTSTCAVKRTCGWKRSR